MAASPTPEPVSAKSVAVFVAPADGVRVLRDLFRSLEGGFPGAIVILAHASDRRERSIADNLNVASSVMVHESAPGVRLRNGHAYVVKVGSRLVIGADGCLADAYGADANDDALLLANEEQPPSAEVRRSESLLSSMAIRYGGNALAVALTALDALEREGFARVRDAGGHTFALDETDRLWADSSGARIAAMPGDERLPIALLGPRLIAVASR